MRETINNTMTGEMLYENLDEERKHIADEFLLFLYQQQEDAYRETLKTVRSALHGENILGSFDSVEEMVEALNA
ncbi:MAG: hypothetical protein IJI57_10205 [Flexilinea sp.]|nr:hypothetical protein [Flexilinea sp.]